MLRQCCEYEIKRATIVRIGIVGTGRMGGTLGRLFANRGHVVSMGSRQPERAQAQFKDVANCRVASLQESVDFGDVVVLATPWQVTHATLMELENLQGKVVVDITNPVSADVSHLTIGGNSSAAEQIAAWSPGALVVKAFNGICAANLERPTFSGEPAQIFYCGEDRHAKNTTADLIEQLGFVAVDCGKLSNARYLEAMAMLSIQMAFAQDHGIDSTFKFMGRRDLVRS
jgi:8-hydroxy-5-deazaflavin:NADPH oxidoreductase